MHQNGMLLSSYTSRFMTTGSNRAVVFIRRWYKIALKKSPNLCYKECSKSLKILKYIRIQSSLAAPVSPRDVGLIASRVHERRHTPFSCVIFQDPWLPLPFCSPVRAAEGLVVDSRPEKSSLPFCQAPATRPRLGLLAPGRGYRNGAVLGRQDVRAGISFMKSLPKARAYLRHDVDEHLSTDRVGRGAQIAGKHFA